MTKPMASAFVLGFILTGARAASAAPAANSAAWLPVDQDVWTILMAEPQAHLFSAQEDLADNRPKDAAAEILLAGTFLRIQEERLAASSQQLNGLAKDVETGVVVSSTQVDATFRAAISALDQQQAMIPVMAGADTVYEDEAAHHLAQAKSRIDKKQGKSAAGDVRKAAAYLKLKALHAGQKTKMELLASAAELERLADTLDAGAETDAKDVEAAFVRANKAVRSAL